MPTSTSRITPTHTQSRGSELKSTATAPHPGENALFIRQPVLSSTTPSGPPEGADHVAVLLDAAASPSARVPSTMASSPVSSAATWQSSTRWTCAIPAGAQDYQLRPSLAPLFGPSAALRRAPAPATGHHVFPRRIGEDPIEDLRGRARDMVRLSARAGEPPSWPALSLPCRRRCPSPRLRR